MGGKSALASRLETISSKAVEKLDEIMGLPLDPDHPAFAPVLRAQTAAVNTALSTQAKVDESAPRRQSVDRMPEILRLADEVRQRLPPWLELGKRKTNRKSPVALPESGYPGRRGITAARLGGIAPQISPQPGRRLIYERQSRS